MNDFEKLKELLSSLPPQERQVISVYHRLQEDEGYVPRDALPVIAQTLHCPEHEQQELISFFDSFRTRPPAAHTVSVCYGTACYARGAPLIYDRIAATLGLDEEGYSPDGSVCVQKVYCVGACSQAPLIVRDGEIRGRLKVHEAPSLVEDYKKEQDAPQKGA